MNIKHSYRSFFAALVLGLASIAANAMTVDEARNEIRYLEAQIAQIAMEYPAPSMALLAMGGTAAAHMETGLDQEVLDAMKVVGAVAALYCLAEHEECGQVFLAINKRVNRINYLQRLLINAGHRP